MTDNISSPNECHVNDVQNDKIKSDNHSTPIIYFTYEELFPILQWIKGLPGYVTILP